MNTQILKYFANSSTLDSAHLHGLSHTSPVPTDPPFWWDTPFFVSPMPIHRLLLWRISLIFAHKSPRFSRSPFSGGTPFLVSPYQLIDPRFGASSWTLPTNRPHHLIFFSGGTHRSLSPHTDSSTLDSAHLLWPLDLSLNRPVFLRISKF